MVGFVHNLRSFLIGLAISPCFWQISLGSQLQPLSEKQLTEKLRNYQDIATIEANFTQVKTLKDMDVTIKSQGHFSVHRPHDIIWQITKPSPITISISNQEIKLEKPSGSEVFKLSQMPSEKLAKSLVGLMAWLEMDAEQLNKDYSVYPDQAHRFRFVPKNKDIAFFKDLLMELDAWGNVRHILITEVTNDTLSLDFGDTRITKK
jgi:outer membrane lipoprotein-sorting protein